MADKDKKGPVSEDFEDFEGDFDFDTGFGNDPFGEEDSGGKAAAKAPGQPADFDEFSEDALGDGFSEDAFEGFGGGLDDGQEEAPSVFSAPPVPEDDDDDAFPAPAAQDDSDDPFGADDGGFGLEEMPTPGSMSARPAAGDPDAEFGDIGGDAFASSDGFDDTEGLFDDDDGGRPADDPFEEEPAAEDPFAEAAGDDPYGSEAEASGDNPFDEPYGAEDAPAEAAAPARKRSGLVMPLALAASVAVAGYFGYSFLLPMFSSPVAPPAQTAAQAPAEPSFPSALPGQPGGLPVAPAQPSVPAVPEQTAMLPVVPDVPALPGQAPELPVLTDAPLEPFVPEQAGVPPEVSLGVQAPSLPAVDGTPRGTPALPSLDDIAGGDGRGGIMAMRGEEERKAAEASRDVADKVTAIEGRLSSIEERVEQIARAVAEMSVPAHPAASAAPAAQAEAPALVRADLSAALPPLKPAIVESATLKGVSRGLAWVSTPSGVVEVREGDVIPGAGKVLRIREYQGRWIVSTAEGLVVQ